jgi:hypothetical protein
VGNELKWGYINTKGEEVIPLRFDYVWPFSNGLALVFVDGKGGYINEKGEIVIAPRFGDARSFDANGLAAVLVNGKWGYIRLPPTK